MLKHWKFKPAITYIPIIVAIGVALGVADNAMGSDSNLLRAIALHSLTSLCIGFPLLLISYNSELIASDQSNNYKLIVLGLIFAFIGVVASEVETFVKTLVFTSESYKPFSGEGLYLFNAILSVILGFGFVRPFASYNTETQSKTDDALMVDKIEPVTPIQAGEGAGNTELRTIPIKKGNSIHLLPIETLSVLEASDKYAYVFTRSGEKHLCDYSLAYLEDRLPEEFKRVHRSYIINTKEISRIQVYDKKRYLISFDSVNVPDVTSSAGYQQVVKTLTRI